MRARTLVAAMVAQQRGALAEVAPTVTTRMGPLTRMCALVAHQHGTLQEALAVLGAFEGLLALARLQVSR